MSDGLFLLVTESGKYWKYAYSYNEKRKEVSLGVYPNVKMKVAKIKLQAIKALLADGVDQTKRSGLNVWPTYQQAKNRRKKRLPMPTRLNG